MKRIALLICSWLFAFLLSCQNSGDRKSYEPALPDSTFTTGLTGDSVKLVKTAGITLKVKSVEQSIRQVSSLVKEFGGSVIYQSLNAEETKRNDLKISSDSLLVISAIAPRADITVRVPSPDFEDFMFSLADIGCYTSNSKLQVDDKSLLYLENALKQKARSATSLKAINQNSKSASLVETVRLRDEAIEHQMVNKAIDGDVHYSTVSLSVFQNPVVKKEIVANTNLSVGQRLRNAFSEGWIYFIEAIVALVHIWMFVVAGAACYFGYKYSLQKRKPELLVRKQS